MSTFIDIHIIQTVPSSNVNRDDTGRPKTAYFGGFERARVSSQAWKRATRKDFESYLPEDLQGVRTLRIIDEIARRIKESDSAIDDSAAGKRAADVMAAAGIKFKTARPKKGEEAATTPQSEYLLFVSNQQIDRLASLALESSDGTVDKAAAKAALNTHHGVDVALFGRMVADDTSINVDASVQVAHAIGTHTVVPEYDYFTAVDDLNKDDASAGMIGVVEFNSSTLYRYATVNLTQLRENLGDDALTLTAVDAFVRSFATSMPTGKQNTFANRTLPDAILVQVRADRPVNLVGAFEVPVAADGESSVSTLSTRRDRESVV
jgi:CRISPR system Cascade subunit CasC